MSREPDRAPPGADDAAPPWPGRWGALYAIVVGELILVILLLAWLTRAFA